MDALPLEKLPYQAADIYPGVPALGPRCEEAGGACLRRPRTARTHRLTVHGRGAV